MAGTGCTVTDAIEVTAVPASLITVSVNVNTVGAKASGAMVEALMPLVTEPTPWSIEPVPSENVWLRVIVSPLVTFAGRAVKLVIDGAGIASTVTIAMTAVPAGLVTVRTYSV